ncbi:MULTISPECIES: nucleotidyltransferase domain-containing protein [Paenibacillus]|uniref:nucleotidyltransferase domain-containing protein n=1 Tax=Paenibacillus TaxID=44249 RepID=UPI0010599DB9|nr:nucleotidyltransferase domain-containing protein [Paenibacillus amylolyticus]MCL6658418.1 nucleotidyltransferase domain-containing protein [Paenibacillus amylolyticus]TDL69213.1 nucleotidyltransferase domain-containing protein [Paenibacillus amylolyticus]
MNEIIKKKLLDKNELLINMVIERVKRDFLDDIAIIGLTGSFSTDDFHEKSDLDLIIINNTEKGWEISDCFILDDVGYDIYCTPWDSRIQEQSNLESPNVSSLTELKILYYAKPEDLEKLNVFRQKALDALAKPIGEACLNRANKWIDLAKQAYSDTMLSEDIGSVRYASAEVLYNLVNALVSMNNTCIKRGIKRYLEEIRSFRYVPDNLESLYMSIIEAHTIEDIRITSFNMLNSVTRLHNTMCDNFIVKPAPTFDNLRGTYEELWCNYRNKILKSVATNDPSYVFLSAFGAHGYLDEMAMEKGTKKFDLMQYFDASNLPVMKEKLLEVMDDYLEEYDKVGRKVEHFTTFEQLYTHYMNH